MKNYMLKITISKCQALKSNKCWYSRKIWYSHVTCWDVFLDLQFADYVYPTKIEILETYNPGAVVRILALESGSTNSNSNKNRLV